MRVYSLLILLGQGNERARGQASKEVNGRLDAVLREKKHKRVKNNINLILFLDSVLDLCSSIVVILFSLSTRLSFSI